jgi:adenine/guanine phosphoribosyltransferase-like PRPP-binding protein
MSYFDEVLDSQKRKNQVQKAIEILSLFEFSHIVVRGISGITMGSVLAYALNKHLIVLRKTKKDSHTDTLVEDPHYENENWSNQFKYLIVDDFVCSGETVTAILEDMKNHTDGEAECIGFWGYTKEWETKTRHWNENHYQSLREVFNDLQIENINLLQNLS